MTAPNREPALCSTCADPLNAGGYCTNKQCSRHGRKSLDLDETLANDEAEGVPVFRESMAGSLIDSARISIMAALALLPPAPEPAIILLDGARDESEDATATIEGCLEQAMQWLDAARAHSVARGAAVTSLHVGGGTSP